MKYLAFILLTCSCAKGSICAIGDSKCQNNQVWICNKSEDWSKIDDCAELATINNVDLVCVPPGPDGPAACLPLETTTTTSPPDAGLDVDVISDASDAG